MKHIRNKKGMTLVEIIVVLLIMSILLVIMGSLILNAFSYFNKTTDQDIYKRSLDSISEYVRNELLYASDVRVQEEKPDDEEWHTLYIVDGKLYKNDEQVYSDGFYNQNDLIIKIRGFEKYRLDLNYSFIDSDNKNVYSNSDTLELLNLKIKIENNEDFDPFSNFSTKTNISEQIKIFYQKAITIKEEEEPENPDDVFTSTKCLNAYNNRGRYKRGASYKTGDMVYYDDGFGGYWYIFVMSDQMNVSGTPLHNLWWKKVSDQYDSRSAYTKGDIIFYTLTKSYYLLTSNKLVNNWPIPPNDEYSGKDCFQKIENDENVKPRIVCSALPDNQNTVASKLDYEDLEDIKDYESGTLYDVGAIVKIQHDDGYVDYYMMVLESSGKNGPDTNPTSGWQRLLMEWDENSSYKKGDIALYQRSNGRYYYIQAQTDINKKVQMTLSNGAMNTEYWKEISER